MLHMVIGMRIIVKLWAMPAFVGVGRADQLPPAPTPAPPTPTAQALHPTATMDSVAQPKVAPQTPTAQAQFLIATAAHVRRQRLAVAVWIASWAITAAREPARKRRLLAIRPLPWQQTLG